jgi:molybdate transport system regulatory protein
MGGAKSIVYACAHDRIRQRPRASARQSAQNSCFQVRFEPADDRARIRSGRNRQPVVRFRMRVIQDDTVALGPGKVSLLEAVRDHGSISAAARSIGMSYRRAWLLMDELNRALESPATVSEHGGQSGGGSTLTPVGEEIIRLYRGIEARAAAACAPEIAALTKLVKG